MAKVGRPKSENPRKMFQNVWLTTEEGQAVKKAAKNANMQVGRWMRSALMQAAQKGYLRGKDD